MKKTVFAVAAMMATSGAAMAANVELYGVVDYALAYTNVDNGTTTTDSLQMEGGNRFGSRFGFRGEEDLGNGYAVAFRLENGFDGDTGALGQNGKLFGREASLTVKGPYGNLSFGRMGALTSGLGTYDVFVLGADVNDGGWSDYIGTNNWFARDRYNNMVTYQTPSFAGFTGYAQYSFGTDTDNGANERDQERYVAVGGQYTVGNLSLVAVYDSIMRDHSPAADAAPADLEDSQAISLGANYKFANDMKVFAGFQYGWNENTDFMGNTLTFDADGFTSSVGVDIPVAGGNMTLAAYYANLEGNDANTSKIESTNFTATYVYPFSQRTSVYVGAAYKDGKVETATVDELQQVTVAAGISHMF